MSLEDKGFMEVVQKLAEKDKPIVLGPANPEVDEDHHLDQFFGDHPRLIIKAINCVRLMGHVQIYLTEMTSGFRKQSDIHAEVKEVFEKGFSELTLEGEKLRVETRPVFFDMTVNIYLEGGEND